MAQIEIKEKELKALMAEGLLVEAIAEKLGVKKSVVKAAAKVFNLNLRRKPTTKTPKYVFVKDEEAETSQEVIANVTNVESKTKKVKEVKQEVVDKDEENSETFVEMLMSKDKKSKVAEESSEGPALNETSVEEKKDDDFGF